MKLHTKILLGLVLGAGAGVAVNLASGGEVTHAAALIQAGVSPDSLRAAVPATARWAESANAWVMGPAGQIFLRMLFMVVVPLVFASLALGVAELGDVRKLGRVGAKTIAYFLGTTLLAATLGLVLVNVLRPGEGLDETVRTSLMNTYRTEAAERMEEARTTSFGIETFVRIVPRNPVQAAAELDMLGLIFFSLVFGAALTLIPKEKAEPVMGFLRGLGEAVVRIIDMAMKLAPYGVFGLIFVTTSRFGFALLKPLALFVATVLAGLALHQFVTLSVVMRALAGVSPRAFFARVRDVMITAFSTSSSSATLPTSLAVAERELGIPPSVAGFVLPLGATMNMNGTALFEGVVVLFIAQVFGAHLSIATQIVVIVLAVLTAVGAAGVPGGSIPLLVIVLVSVGLPGEAIAIVIGVDRILDMCRTVVNVTGDLGGGGGVGGGGVGPHRSPSRPRSGPQPSGRRRRSLGSHAAP